MARSEARLQFGIWREGLDGHGPHAKLLYAVLLTEPTLNQAGVGAVRIPRWARNASLTVEETQKALAELAGDDPLTAQVLCDEDTEEVLIRTMIRNDGVADQPFVLKGALAQALQLASPLLRWVLANELRKLPPRQPDGVSKSGKKIVYGDPHAIADLLDPPGSRPPGTRDPSETLSKGSRHPLDTISSPSTPTASPQVGGDPFETHSKGNGVGEGVGEGVIGSVGQYSSSCASLTRDTHAPPSTPPATTTALQAVQDGFDGFPVGVATPATIEADFETWWTQWPRKIAKQAALASYHRARKKKIPADLLLTAATEQLAAWRAEGRPKEKIPHATTWLNQERWNDEVERPKFTVINNPESPWDGYRIDNSESPWAADMGWTS